MATQTARSMVSETSICNQALSWLGANRITSLDERSTEAELCRDNYPFIRDAVLEAREWKFAVDRYVSTVADQPAWGDLYEHALPLDWIGVYNVYSDEIGTQCQWEREGRFVVADATTVYMKGVKRITDTGHMSPLFVQCLAARMAVELCLTLTGRKLLLDDMEELYEKKLAEAAARDGAQGRTRKFIEGKMITNRWGAN